MDDKKIINAADEISISHPQRTAPTNRQMGLGSRETITAKPIKKEDGKTHT